MIIKKWFQRIQQTTEDNNSRPVRDIVVALWVGPLRLQTCWLSFVIKGTLLQFTAHGLVLLSL